VNILRLILGTVAIVVGVAVALVSRIMRLGGAPAVTPIPHRRCPPADDDRGTPFGSIAGRGL
jgi:hypothetical protein